MTQLVPHQSISIITHGVPTFVKYERQRHTQQEPSGHKREVAHNFPKFDISTSSAKTIPFVLGPTGAGSATAPTSVEELVVRFLRLAKPTALVLRPRGAISPTPSASREHLIRVSGHPHNGDCAYQKQGNTKTHQGIPTGTEG